MPGEIILRNEGFILARGWRTQSTTAAAVGKQKEMNAGPQLSFPSFPEGDPLLGWAFPPSLNPSREPLTTGVPRDVSPG